MSAFSDRLRRYVEQHPLAIAGAVAGGLIASWFSDSGILIIVITAAAFGAGHFLLDSATTGTAA